MESTNLEEQQHHHQLEDHQFIGSSNSSLESTCFSVGSNDHAWRTSNFIMDKGNVHASNDHDEAAPGSLNNSMIQDMGFPWSNTGIEVDQHLISDDKIKQDLSASDHDNIQSFFPKFTDMLNPSTSPTEMLLLKTLSPQLELSPFHEPRMQKGSKAVTGFSQIFPSVNISNLISNSSSSNNSNEDMSSLVSDSGTMEMNSLLTNNVLELFNCHEHLQQQSSDLKLWDSSSSKLSSFNNNGVQDSKRHSCITEPKSVDHDETTASKRPRQDPRISCPPFKVRKEKLGDRIAALQQLVAPFGKTDTASVLMEAIGYIKFLQNQVETLSVPYLKPSPRNKSTISTCSQRQVADENYETGESKPDLRSKGLCLVPLSCMSYFTSCDVGNGGFWPPSNFNSGF